MFLKIPLAAFIPVVTELRDVYPDNFEERLRNGQRCGEGYTNSLRIITNYNNNQNQPYLNKSLGNNLKIQVNSRKTIANLKAGCSNWQPEKFPDEETEESQEVIRCFLLSYST